jgi:hypothetical protein
MNVTFVHSNGVKETVAGVGVTVAIQYAPGLTNLSPLVITTPAGTTPVQGNYGGGSNAWNIAGDGGYYLRFYGGDTQVNQITKFKMDDAAALLTAYATIEAAFAADDAAVTIDSTGAAYTGS